MLNARKRFHPVRGSLPLAMALALVAGTAPPGHAQKSESKASGPQRMQSAPRSAPRAAPRSSPRSSPRAAPRSSPRSRPSTTVRSGSSSRSSVGSSSRSSKGRGLPRSGYSSGPTVYRKGTIPPSASRRGGPTPGPRYTPRDSGRGHGVRSGSHHHSHGRHHSFYSFRLGFGRGFYGFYGYPHYYGPYSFYRAGYAGLDYGYYPHYYDSSYYPHATRYRTVRVEPQGGLDLNVRPKDTEVYLNGYYVGTVGDFDG